ncbi:MAG: hypothetical protein R3A48_23060 [Polyangiales bacterium]
MQNTEQTNVSGQGMSAARRRASEVLVHARDVLGVWSTTLKGATEVDLRGMVRAIPDQAEVQLDALLARVGLARLARIEAERAAKTTSEPMVMDIADELGAPEPVAVSAPEPVAESAPETESAEVVEVRASNTESEPVEVVEPSAPAGASASGTGAERPSKKGARRRR